MTHLHSTHLQYLIFEFWRRRKEFDSSAVRGGLQKCHLQNVKSFRGKKTRDAEKNIQSAEFTYFPLLYLDHFRRVHYNRNILYQGAFSVHLHHQDF